MTTDKTLLDTAIEAAETAGAAARAYGGNLDIELKQADQVVTQADRYCQELIVEQIDRRFAGHGIVAEESENGGELLTRPPTGPDDIWWIIDPIDGTRNYAAGAGHYAVSIGVWQNGKPRCGVIYEPTTDTLYTAGDGKALRNSMPIRCDNTAPGRNSIIAVPGQAQPGQCLIDVIGQFMLQFACVNMGSAALHYAGVAGGMYAGTCSWKVKLWDIAAGAALVDAAGGKVTGINGDDLLPIDLHNYTGQAVPVIMGGGAMHAAMLEIITKHTPEA